MQEMDEVFNQAYPMSCIKPLDDGVQIVSAVRAGFTCQINRNMEEQNDATVQGIPQSNLVVNAAAAALMSVR